MLIKAFIDPCCISCTQSPTLWGFPIFRLLIAMTGFKWYKTLCACWQFPFSSALHLPSIFTFVGMRINVIVDSLAKEALFSQNKWLFKLYWLLLSLLKHFLSHCNIIGTVMRRVGTLKILWRYVISI